MINRKSETERAFYVGYRSMYLQKYGLTPSDYLMIWERQGGECAICTRRKLVVDHDHETGKIRGLLCGRCNTGLGMFQDSQIRLSTAIDYLETARH